MVDQPGSGSPVREAIMIAFVYMAVSGIWVTISNIVLQKWLSEPSEIASFQTINGWGFVIVTSLVLFGGTLRYLRAVHSQLDRFEGQRAELHMLSQFQESVIDNASVWINVLDTSAHVLVWNKAAEQISGYTREEVIGNELIWEWLYPDPNYRAQVTNAVLDILGQGREVEALETEIRTKAGKQKTIAWNSRRFFDEDKAIIGSIAIGRDITAYKQAEHDLVEQERQIATLTANLPGMVYRCKIDDCWAMKFVSKGCHQLTGYEADALIDNNERSYASIIHEDDLPQVMSAVQLALKNNRSFATEYRIQHRDGHDVWVWEQGREVTVDGKPYLEGIVMDISRRKAMEQELEVLASRDALTGLYNRRELEQQFHEELLRAKRYKRPLSLLWIDVDHFKLINDRFGHQEGDKVLRRLGQLLQSGVRTLDYAARYGGEELAIVLPEMDEINAMEMAERLRQVVEQTRMLVGESNDHEAQVTICLGVATYPNHGTTMEELFRAADRAMYQAKQNGRNQVCMAV